MLGTYFYHEILRKPVISFGTLFNDIHIRHKDQTGKSISSMKVALAYGPMQKFLARIEQQADLNRATALTLPRMSFEMTTISYDATRKASITQTFKASDGSNLRKVFMPVPYNIGFELNILVKLNDDALQIVEQILPFFQPSFNLTVDLVSVIGEKRDISVCLALLLILQRDLLRKFSWITIQMLIVRMQEENFAMLLHHKQEKIMMLTIQHNLHLILIHLR